MHPCLRVDEILRLVFRCVEGRSTLCALARTCRTFNEPAMDLIWETLTAMEPILQHLSSASLVEKRAESYFALSRPLSDDDWSIIRRLSSRVRRLHFFLKKNVPLHDDIDNDVPQWFRLLTSPPDQSFLFPNLRALSFEVDGYLDAKGIEDTHAETFQAVIRLFHLLLRPRLSALRFEIPSSFYAHLDISSIPALCPNLHALSIGGPSLNCFGDSIPDEAMFLFSRVVSGLCHLEVVRCCATSWELLSSLAQVKGLRRLWVFLPYRLGRGPQHRCGNMFPQLHTLDIQAESLASCTELFRWASFDKITHIYIDCSFPIDDDDSVQTLFEMSSLISSQCKHLEFLWIFSSFSRGDEIPAAWPRPMLETYQAFRQLSVIALQTSLCLTLADNDFGDMVKAWPHLEVFHLFQDGILRPPVHLTLRGVTALLYHCPKLKHFTLMFDATHVPAPLSNSALVRNTAVRYMGVYTSPVSESRDVAAYLSTIMPYLKVIGIEAGGGYGPEWFWICTRHQQRPAIRVDMLPMALYRLVVTGTENDGGPQVVFGREWCWKSRRDWD
ncbi:hypothetical protein BKA82DRAFT_4182809 [Pisolithus tinctorius]|nr:hypothetical protein BKA82DRAFT_4182809 [Pisolithus tinctorius]